VVVGSPDFAPQIVNISTLSDTMFDVGVRFYNLVPQLCQNGEFNQDYRANYQRDIQPIIDRLSRYQWVANVQAMSAFNSRQFDYADNSDANKSNRENYFSYFRGLSKEGDPSPDQPQQVLFKDNFPMLPLNSGSNSVSNDLIMKFLALDATQQFLLSQWAAGRFDADCHAEPYPVHALDQGSVGNCVGLPMCPGIEVTWNMQNPNIYAAPYRISDQRGPNGYNSTGLTPSRGRL
jgi:L-lysine 6-oxidase